MVSELQTYQLLPGQMTPRGPWMLTAGGNAWYPCDPRPEDFELSDISHALARISRFTGATFGDVIFSVAQHSINVSTWMEEDGHDPYTCYCALFHDVDEVVFNDVASPAKHALKGKNGNSLYDHAVAKVKSAIYEKFDVGITSSMQRDIKRYDITAYVTETAVLQSVPKHLSHLGRWWAEEGGARIREASLDDIVPRTPTENAALFMLRYANLADRIVRSSDD